MKTNLQFITSHSILLKMRSVSDKIVEEIKTHILCSVTFFLSLFLSFLKSLPFIRYCGKILYS
jgi:hypothetical protein